MPPLALPIFALCGIIQLFVADTIADGLTLEELVRRDASEAGILLDAANERHDAELDSTRFREALHGRLRSAEYDRLAGQFQVLDHRFDAAADFYLHGAKHKWALAPRGHERPAILRKEAGLATSEPPPDAAVPYGFYLHVFFEAAAVVNQARSIRKFYPEAPIYIMSDGGANFSKLCAQVKNCRFAWRAPAHDCWNPKPFFDRFRDAAEWLQTRKALWTVFLEPDVTLLKRASIFPEADAGGLRDVWNPKLSDELRAKMEELGRTFSGKTDFHLKWTRFGLAGGSIVRTQAAVVAFKPNNINWPLMESLGGPTIYSSDIAMPIVLGSHGFTYAPWDGVREGDKELPRKEHAFVHHGKADPSGKPFYYAALSAEDQYLVEPPPVEMQPDLCENDWCGQCQHCIWQDESECWPSGRVGVVGEGKIGCKVDRVSFRSRVWSAQPPRPELFHSSVADAL